MDQIVTALTNGLKRNFIKWVQQIELHANVPLLDLDKHSLFLSFNYTQTLEKLYRVEESKINHIHGVVTRDDSDLLFGHGYVKPNTKPNLEKIRRDYGEKAYNDYLEELGAEDVRVREGREILDSYFPSTYKPTKDIINDNRNYFKNIENIDEVIILGHSLGYVDIPYFEAIHNRIVNPNTVWTVSYYDEKDIPRHYKTLMRLGVKGCQIKQISTKDLCASHPTLFPSTSRS